MSTINRLLSRRDKSHKTRKEKHLKQNGARPPSLLVHESTESNEHSETEEEAKIKAISQRLSKAGITTFKDNDISHVLASNYANGDSDRAYELIILLEDSEAGVIRSYDPEVKLLGAVNREGVTCFLDALLFAMFARLGSFEAMLYKNFEDPPRKRLATLLRLWVNALRAGKLITTDITKQIQLQLAKCGWKEAEELSQQDSSEAFSFITSTLALPLLTLKMDIFHTGKEDASDDHKFINERLLEIAIPDEPLDGHVITLEECLEMYFNNRIEVKRYLDQLERRNTLNSIRSRRSLDSSKAHSSHIEVAEVSDFSNPTSPAADQPQTSPIPISPARPIQRTRAPSIIQEHYIDEKKTPLDRCLSLDEKNSQSGRMRKEVMMPAWQFFSLIPWYTNNVPSNDAQVAAHFSSARPILGICLKRYSIQPDGTAVKRKTHIDIPLEIALPNFIQDDDMSEDGPAFGNFKLSLQSVVCHQGITIQSGHYISLVRSPDPDHIGEDRWMRFDDLAGERVTYTNVETFLLEESPYLLFYQVIPISSPSSGGIPDAMSDDQPPAYSESNVSRDSKVDSGVSGLSASPGVSYDSSEGLRPEMQKSSFEIRPPSSDTSTSENGKMGRSSMNSERSQPADTNRNGITVPGKEHPTNQLNGTNNLTAHSPVSKSLPIGSRNKLSARSDDSKRFSASFSRLAGRLSRDKFDKSSTATADPIPITESPRNSLNLPPPPTHHRDLPALVAVTEKALAANEKSNEKAKLKKEVKEKSKAAQRESQISGKETGKEEKPDRECVVM
ncbi:hypothetical protein ACLMJK_009277 [Lecanora helva]